MAVATDPSTKQAKKDAPAREWAPPFWTGMSFGGWAKLLYRNRFAVDLQHAHIAASITAMSLLHSMLGGVQTLQFGWWLRRAKVEQPPVFVLGHWRAGTTLLHELMVLDERHTSPSTYACMNPNHFVATEPFARRWLNFLLPSHRPMDNMPTGWERPQEDEFALANLGLPSSYLTIAFPNHPPQFQEYLTLEGLPPGDVDHWKRGLMRFLSHVCYQAPKKRIILKSPPHTGRVKTLLEMFPSARFVHIVRDPYTVFASTVNLWKTLYTKHGLQTPRYEGLEEYVLQTFEQIYDKFERDRSLLSADQFCEVRYEDLVRDPEMCIRQIYEQLDLGELDKFLPALRAYLASMDGYQTNRYPQLTSDQRQQVAQRWGRFFRRYGYA
jgi:omega-hydroxy-beta-dihydromenaquinone-9 sulfotransferase